MLGEGLRLMMWSRPAVGFRPSSDCSIALVLGGGVLEREILHGDIEPKNEDLGSAIPVRNARRRAGKRSSVTTYRGNQNLSRTIEEYDDDRKLQRTSAKRNIAGEVFGGDSADRCSVAGT